MRLARTQRRRCVAAPARGGPWWLSSQRRPAWGVTLAFPVPAWAAGVDAGALRVSVIHWAAPGCPALLGETAPVAVSPRDLGLHAGAPLHARAMPLLGATAPRGATLHLRLGILPPGAEEYALAISAEAAAERDAAMKPLQPPAPAAAAAAASNGGHAHRFSLSDWDPSFAEAGVPPPPEAEASVEAGAGDGKGVPMAADSRRRLSSPGVVLKPGGGDYGGVPRSSSATNLAAADLRLSNGSGTGSLRPPMHPPAAHGSGGSGGGAASRAVALAAAGDAARDLLTTLATPGGGGVQGGVGAKLTQAVTRLASAAVVAAQAAAASEPGDLHLYADAGGPVGDRTSYGSASAAGGAMPPAGALVRAGSPNGTRAPTGMDRLLAAGARAVDAAVAAANHSRPPASNGGSPGHSRGESWDDGASWRPPGHHRSGSADSAADAVLMFSHTAGRGASSSDVGPSMSYTAGDVADLQRRLLDAQRRVRELEAALSLEAQLREAEDVRALVEGARFVLHTPTGTKIKFVWYNAQRQRLCWAASAERRADASERAKHFVPLAAVEGVEAGAALFDAALPGSAGGGGGGSGKPASWLGGGKPAPPPRDARAAFSVLVAADAHARPGGGGAEAAGTFPAALHLELPPGGNGRSGREWVSAFATGVKRARANSAAPAAAGALLSSALGALGQRMNGGGSHAERNNAAAANGTTPSRATRAAAAALALLDAGAQRATASATASGAATPTPQLARGSPGPGERGASPDARRVLRMDDASEGSDQTGGGHVSATGNKGSGNSIAEEEQDEPPRTPAPASA